MNVVPAQEINHRDIASEQEAHIARVRDSLDDVEAGRVRKFKTAAELLETLDSDS
jgi:hypothetical protein